MTTIEIDAERPAIVNGPGFMEFLAAALKNSAELLVLSVRHASCACGGEFKVALTDAVCENTTAGPRFIFGGIHRHKDGTVAAGHMLTQRVEGSYYTATQTGDIRFL